MAYDSTRITEIGETLTVLKISMQKNSGNRLLNSSKINCYPIELVAKIRKIYVERLKSYCLQQI